MKIGNLLVIAIAFSISIISMIGCGSTTVVEKEVNKCPDEHSCSAEEVCASQGRCIPKPKEAAAPDHQHDDEDVKSESDFEHCSSDFNCEQDEICTSQGLCFPEMNTEDVEEEDESKSYLKVVRDGSTETEDSGVFWVPGSESVPVARYDLSVEGESPVELTSFKVQASTRDGHNTHSLSMTEVDKQIASCQAFDGEGFAITNAAEPIGGEIVMKFTGGFEVRSGKMEELVVKCDFVQTTASFSDPFEDLLFEFSLLGNSSFTGNFRGQYTKVVSAKAVELHTRGLVRQDVVSQAGPFSGNPGEFVNISEGLLEAQGEAIYLRRLDLINCLNYDADGKCGNDPNERPGDFIFEDVGITIIDEGGIRHGVGFRSVDSNHWTVDWRFKIERGEQVKFVISATIDKDALKGSKGQLTLSPGFAKKGEDFWQGTKVSSSRPRFKAKGSVSRKPIFDRSFPSRLPNGNAAHTFTVK